MALFVSQIHNNPDPTLLIIAIFLKIMQHKLVKFVKDTGIAWIISKT